MQSLPIFVRLQGRRVLLIGEGEAADAKARLIERAGGIIIHNIEDESAALAFIALEDTEQAAKMADQLKARGLLVNVVDKPALCDFTTPAIIDRAPVIIAIGTGGASAGLAKAIRQRFETLLPQNLGALADKLFAARARMKAILPRADERRRFIDQGLQASGAIDPFRDCSADQFDSWLESDNEALASRTVAIQLASYDPDDLTLRAARLLGEADHIIHPQACPPDILSRARADAQRHIAPGNNAALDGLIITLHAPPLP